MRGRSVILVACLSTVGVRSAARADTVDELFLEIRDLIEDVIRSEVAQDIVRNIRSAHPALCFHFRGALGRMLSSYWGGVPSQLREGIGILSADFAYWYITHDVKTEPYVCKPNGGASGAYEAFKEFICIRDKELRDEHSEGIPACTPEGWSREKTVLEEQCTFDAVDSTKALACAFSKAGLAVLRGAPREASDTIIDYLISAVGGKEKGLLGLVVNGTRDASELLNGVSTEIAGLIEDATEVCQLSFDLRGSSPCWFMDFWKILHGDNSAELIFQDYKNESIEVGHSKVSFLHDIPLLLKNPREFLSQPVAALSNEQSEPRKDETSDWDKLAARSGKVGSREQAVQVRVALGTAEARFVLVLGEASALYPVNGRAIQPAALQELISGLRHLELMNERARVMQRALKDFGIPVENLTVAGIRSALNNVRNLAISTDLIKGVLLKANRDEVVHGMEGLMRIATIFLEQTGVAVDAAVVEHIKALRNDPVFALLAKLIDSHDYRELAVAGLTAILDQPGSLEPVREQYRGLEAAERQFLVEFSAYVLDAGHGDGEQRTLARDALRNSVKTILLAKAEGGFPTKTGQMIRSNRASGTISPLLAYVNWTYRPALSVRWEFAGHWYDRSNAEYRRTISADVATAAIAMSDHMGLKLSLIDLAAPLAELALRDTSLNHENQGVVVLDALRPRVDLWLGLPELTRRVVVFAGLSLSGVRRTLVDQDMHYSFDLLRPEMTIDMGTALLLW